MSKIVLKEMRFDDILSYGKGNIIDFQQGRVVQLVGSNGSGKSSIATILEEVLYNKNSKGLTKAELFSWNLDTKHYHIEVDFSKDQDEYTVIKDVKSTAKVTLLCNGEDISGHTATQTYKLISDIFGCDFTTFTKMVYQSVGSSLDFLKATDAKRKEFLTDLFDQEIYKATEAKVKADISELDKEVSKTSGAINSTSKMLKSLLADSQIVVPPHVEVPEYDDTEANNLISDLRVQAALAVQNKAMIDKKVEADRRVLAAKKAFEKFTEEPADITEGEVQEVRGQASVYRANLAEAQRQVKDFSTQSAARHCRTCGSVLDVSGAEKALGIAKISVETAEAHLKEIEPKLEKLSSELKYRKDYLASKQALESAIAYSDEYSTVDSSSCIADVAELNSKVRNLQLEIQENKQNIEDAKRLNAEADKKQTLKDSALGKLEALQKELEELNETLDQQQALLADLQVIAKSLKDIVGYKLECNVKIFEELINKYLSELTDGEFALTFELSGTKLNVVIFNNGRQTSMASCSTGQQQRIQTATLLAIRSLLSAISKVDINLLFLDEVISYIDTQGIETLIEVLLSEHDLNSFIVSHGHSHPLAGQIKIVRDANKVSRLESGN